jgi:hypothetical protein
MKQTTPLAEQTLEGTEKKEKKRAEQSRAENRATRKQFAHLDEVVTVLELSLLREEQGIVRQVGGGGGGQRAGGQVGQAARRCALVVLLEDGAEQLPLPQPVVVLGMVGIGSSPALFL